MEIWNILLIMYCILFCLNGYYLWNNFKITALARIEGVWGTQFHPEKSGEKGLRLFNKMITLQSDQIL